VFGSQVEGFLCGQLLCEHIQDGLHVVIGIQDAPVLQKQLFFELRIVDHVAVVGHDDTKGGVDEEGLGVFSASTSHGRVTRVSDPNRATQPLRMGRIEDVVDQPIAFFGMKTPVIRDHARGILPTVLYGQEALVQVLEHVLVAVDS